MLVIGCEDRYRGVVAWAREQGLLSELMATLGYLANYGSQESRCTLHPDFAPQSFIFVMEFRDKNGEWAFFMNGGVIFSEARGSLESGWGVHT